MGFDPSELVKRETMKPQNAGDALSGHSDEAADVFADVTRASGQHYIARGVPAGSKRLSPVHPGVKGGNACQPVITSHRAQRSAR